jgi:hypothetical protein
MNPKHNIISEISTLTMQSFQFIKEQFTDREQFIKFCNAIGWNVTAIAGDQIDAVREMVISATGIDDELEFSSIKSFENVTTVIKKFKFITKAYEAVQYFWFEPDQKSIDELAFLNGPLTETEINDGWLIPLMKFKTDLEPPLEDSHPYATEYEN